MQTIILYENLAGRRTAIVTDIEQPKFDELIERLAALPTCKRVAPTLVVDRVLNVSITTAVESGTIDDDLDP